MENLKLETEIRSGSGKGLAHRLRARGMIPAILYGRKEEPLGLAVDEAAMRKMMRARAEISVIDLSIKGEMSDAPINVLVRGIQRHPATGKLLHVDFQRIRLDEKVRLAIHITLHGVPKGVTDQGGVLEHGMRTANVSCLPTAIPEAFALDVSELMIGDNLRFRDLIEKYPDVQFLDDPALPLATITPPKIEAEVAPKEAEPEVAEPELVKKEKEKEKEPEEGTEKS